MAVFDYQDQILIVDAGAMFPDNDMFGVDLVIPDYTWLEENQDRIAGIVISHGHEDHPGGLPFLLRRITAPPIYASRLTLGLIEAKLNEHPDIKSPTGIEVHAGDTIEVGPFSVEFVHVNHSIPGAFALGIRTQAGLIVHTCDFKIDRSPVDGRVMDTDAFARFGDEGVRLLICDVTNVEQPGHVKTQQIVGRAFERILREAKGRVIITTFASNIHRIQQAFDVAHALGRKVVIEGRSMLKTVDVAERLGYLTYERSARIDLGEMRDYAPEELLILTTGSQGEPTSVLTRISLGEHKKLVIEEGDTVIHSATPIPGNEGMIWRTVNNLCRLGAEVIYKAIDEVHVSGHGYQEELRLVLSLTRPEHIVPYHGEPRHQRYYRRLADEMGIQRERVHVLEPYDVLAVGPSGTSIVDRLDGDALMVDGALVGDVGASVLRERRLLSECGVVFASLTVEADTREILDGPDIQTRGLVYVDEAEALIDEALDLVSDTVESADPDLDTYELERLVKSALTKLFKVRLGRRPMIVPVIFEVEGGRPVQDAEEDAEEHLDDEEDF